MVRYHLLMGRHAVATALAFSACLCGCTIGNDTSVDLERAKEFDGYPLYWSERSSKNWSSLMSPPVELLRGSRMEHARYVATTVALRRYRSKIFPLCFHLSLVSANGIWTRRKIRGAPVGAADGAPLMFTRRTEIKVYRGQGSDPGMALRALHALRSLNAVPPRIDPIGSIPPPAPGVLDGTAPCPG